MSRTLKDFLEVYKPASKDEQDFVDKHVTIKHKDRNGNDDEVFKAKKVKAVKRSTEHGYDPGADEAVYEDVEQIDEISNELRSKWISATWKKHLAHVDDTPEQIKNGKPEMPAARKKVFGREQKKHWKIGQEQEKAAHAKKIQAHTPKVHDLRHMSHGEVYDHTQTSDKIHDGDVMHVKGGVAAMVQAWPVMVHGHSKTLHKFKDGVSLHTTDNGIYKKTAVLADKTHGIKEDWEQEEIDSLLSEAFEMIEEGLSEEQLDETAEMVEILKEEFPELEEADLYAIAVASVTGVDIEEEVEELEELSRDTLGSYARKAIDSVDDHVDAAEKISKLSGEVARRGDRVGANQFGKMAADRHRKAANRAAGTRKAIEKLTKEEVEEIDELSNETLNKVIAADSKRYTNPSVHTKRAIRLLKNKPAKKVAVNEEEELEEGVGVRCKSFAEFKNAAQEMADHITHDGKVHFHTKEVSAGGKTWHQTSSNIHNMRNGGFYSYGHFNHSGKGASEEGHGRHVTPFELDEETQIDELSKDTLKSYATKAADDYSDQIKTYDTDEKRAKKFMKSRNYTLSNKASSSAYAAIKKAGLRRKGITAAMGRLTKEDIINNAIDRFLPEDYEIPSLEERLLKKLNGITESNVNALLGLFRSLNSHNQEVMYEECDTLEGVNKLLDLTIQARGK